MEPKLTIITALRCDTPEKKRWFAECAESVLAQDFEDWEWVVVDDASPHTPDLVSDVRVRVVRASTNQGPAMCRNTAVRLARTEAVLPLDGDDKLAPGALTRLWAVWDPKRFVYGDIQLIENGMPGRTIPFPPYTFQGSMKFMGEVPVTALHGVSAWRAGGGWKTEFDAGLEDLEYWISLGAAGFCGKKLDGPPLLLYRKHTTSRSQAMRMDQRQKEMEQKIREYHADLYKGEYPMGCCGGRRGAAASSTNQLPIKAEPRKLTGTHIEGGKVLTRYNGRRTGHFQVRGKITGEYYQIDEQGQIFEVWAADAPTFQRLGRGKDFTVGVPAPPPQAEPEPVQPQEQEQKYEPPPPPLAEIVSVDSVAAPPPLVSAEPIVIVKDIAPREGTVQGHDMGLDKLDEDTARMIDPPVIELDDFKLNARTKRALKALFDEHSWTVPMLVRVGPEALTPYKGIGQKTAERIIEEAKRLWN